MGRGVSFRRLARSLAEAGSPTGTSDGVAIVLPVPTGVAKKLRIKGGLPAGELHVTIAFLGKSSEFDSDRIQRTRKAIERWIDGKAPIPALIGGIGRFPGGKDGDPVYAPVDAPRLTLERPALLRDLSDQDVSVKLNHGFSPHVTLAYVVADEDLPTQRLKPVEVYFDRVELWNGSERIGFDLVSDYDTPDPEFRDPPRVEHLDNSGLYNAFNGSRRTVKYGELYEMNKLASSSLGQLLAERDDSSGRGHLVDDEDSNVHDERSSAAT